MARKHGWQRPAHGYQVVAITVFFLLTTAYYVLFSPFLGKDIYVYVANGVYSLSALSVIILYVRCTAIDPADPGIHLNIEETSAYLSQNDTDTPGKVSTVKETCEAGSRNGDNYDIGLCSKVGGLICGIIATEDCCKDEDISQQSEDEALFCAICNSEVRKFSKHCRSCDKCVDVYDHHCRWLNNCVGRKNYHTFLCLMAASVLWLLVELGVGVAVLVRCFIDRKGVEHELAGKLGAGFSRPPYASVMALCIALSLLAIVPLVELFVFHMILVRKGITTYEYIVAMRAQSEPPGPSIDGDQHSLHSSPASSAVTATSGKSPIGMSINYKGAWCTPPRIFMEHQDEIIPHLDPRTLPSTVDPDTVQPLDKGKKLPRRQVKLSAWKLAKLDSDEAIKAGEKARASSSVLRPISSRHQPYDVSHLSSADLSGRSSPVEINQDFHGHDFRVGSSGPSPRNSFPPSCNSREDVETIRHDLSNLNIPQPTNMALSPLDQHQQALTRDHYNPMYISLANQSLWSARPATANNSGASEDRGYSVYWDPEAGRFISSTSRGANHSSHVRGAELSYTGQSIFFGGPIVNESQGRGAGNHGTGAVVKDVGSTSSYLRQGTRLQRAAQLPVFVPKDSAQHQYPSKWARP